MLLEAEKRGCVEEILTIAAIKQAGGIRETRKTLTINGGTQSVGEIPNECINTSSDLITEMNLYKYAAQHAMLPYQLTDMGVKSK